ncbi:Uncharacterised protein [Niallia circulans]|jgi:hypothetical protein|uniref:hypothetical protein n=1 Tax=Shouchella clausii TaxID=79880 RepID=UPI000BA51771|nr:hypothetical protein [Shouchella clausii]MCM3548500.1 hypothetical protein [Shouchella clausii]PAF13797.1 hypothetical protein CHH59_12195 [Shouchella clausii]SPT78366.1 Uncharacterised protein [Niallia circulans]
MELENLINQGKELVNGVNWDYIKPYTYQVAIFLLLFLFLLIIMLLVIDHLYKSKYKLKIRTRTLENNLGGGQEEFQNYWLWQRNKKKMIIRYFHSNNKVCYSRYARKWRKYEKTRIPLRREIYSIL